MNVNVIEEKFDPSDWNIVANHPLQSWEWGEARKQMGIEVVRVGEFSGIKLKNVFQMTLHKLPYVKWKAGYLPRSVFPSKQVLDFLSNYCKKNNIISVKLEPSVEKKTKIDPVYQLVKTTHSIFPEWTQIIDLTKSEEELLKQMRSKTRYNVRLAQKKGVFVKEESNDRGFAIFLKLYFETTKRQNYYGHNNPYHQAVWDNLNKNISHILIAYYQDTPLVAYELFHFKDRLYYVYGGSSEEYRNLMAAQLTMWETLKLGKKLGAKSLDLWGSLPPDYDPTHPWAGFTRFKEGYGGKFVQLSGSYDFVVNKTLYKLFDLIYRLRNSYLIIKGKFR